MNDAVKTLRSLSDHGFDYFMETIQKKREGGMFVGQDKYTPIPFIEEIVKNSKKLGQENKLDVNINIWYTIEMAFYLSRKYYDDISILLREHDEEIKKYCDKFGFKYYIIKVGDKKMEKRFEMVGGNPPFSKTVVSDKNTKGKSVQLWPDFIKDSFALCVDGGEVALIHPNGWRDVGDPYNLWNIMTEKQIHDIRMFGLDMSRELFAIELKFDYVITENVAQYTTTQIVDSDNVAININLNSVEFISNNQDLVKLIAKPCEECVELIHERSRYGTDKPNMNLEKTKVFKYPCAYTITNSGKMNLWYSSTNNGHFGIPKVIFGNGASSRKTICDAEGLYGLTQFAKAIVDTKENLPMIKKALENSEFIKLIQNASCGQQSYDHKLIRLLRKDFWKDFV